MSPLNVELSITFFSDAKDPNISLNVDHGEDNDLAVISA